MAGLDERVQALETQVKTLAERLDMESGLAASRDRDVSEIQVTLRSHTRMLEALREGQVAHSRALVEMGSLLGSNTEQLLALRAEMGTVKAGIAVILERLQPTDGERPTDG